MKKLDLLIVGVGGQGVVLASDIIGGVAIDAGYDVKKTDTLGMAQRGGSVLSHLRIGRQVGSPLIKQGEVDILLALEKLEAARWSYFLKDGGTAIVNNHALPPMSVNTGNEQYPADNEITDIIKKKTDRIYFIDGTRRVAELGNARTLNVFMLGCFSLFAPFKVGLWKKGILQNLPPRIQEINITAFKQGRKEIRGIRI